MLLFTWQIKVLIIIQSKQSLQLVTPSLVRPKKNYSVDIFQISLEWLSWSRTLKKNWTGHSRGIVTCISASLLKEPWQGMSYVREIYAFAFEKTPYINPTCKLAHYQGKRVNTPKRPCNRVNPSKVIFRYSTQFFQGCYSRDAWTAESTFALPEKKMAGRSFYVLVSFHTRDFFLHSQHQAFVTFCSFGCSLICRLFGFMELN